MWLSSCLHTNPPMFRCFCAVASFSPMSPTKRSSSACRWVARLPTIFSQHGLTDVQARKYPPSPEHYRLFTNSYLLMYEDMARALATRGPGPEVESLRNLLSAASQEADAGVGLVSTPEVVVGRKDADGSVAEARNGEMGWSTQIATSRWSSSLVQVASAPNH